jgi:oligopeptide/dipeptide ABC transporter ATP-binding protein
MTEAALLEVEGLVKSYAVRRTGKERLGRKTPRRLVAVDDVSLSVGRGETVGIVGESGSGKTTVARSIVRLIEPDAGQIRFDGADVLSASQQALRGIRRRLQMIYQDPYSSLNPRLSVGEAIAEPARVHHLVHRAREDALVADLLRRVGLTANTAGKRPRELSGGQRQRVAIARALALEPDAIIADEPVSALDVSIQGQILNLLEGLRSELGLSTLIIAHQLSVIAHITQRVIVMYLGRVVEEGPTDEVFANPSHPYTVALLNAHPSVDAPRGRRTPALRGELPSPLAVPSGCRFRTRCPVAEARCATVDPPPVSVSTTHRSWCLLTVPNERSGAQRVAN